MTQMSQKTKTKKQKKKEGKFGLFFFFFFKYLTYVQFMAHLKQGSHNFSMSKSTSLLPEVVHLLSTQQPVTITTVPNLDQSMWGKHV